MNNRSRDTADGPGERHAPGTGRHRPLRRLFQFALVITGFAICLTAWLMYLVTVRELDPSRSETSGLMTFVEEYGTPLLIGELTVLLVLTVATIVTDSVSERRMAKSEKH